MPMTVSAEALILLDRIAALSRIFARGVDTDGKPYTVRDLRGGHQQITDVVAQLRRQLADYIPFPDSPLGEATIASWDSPSGQGRFWIVRDDQGRPRYAHRDEAKVRDWLVRRQSAVVQHAPTPRPGADE